MIRRPTLPKRPVRLSRKAFAATATALMLLVLAIASYVVVPELTTRTVVAQFPAAPGLYPGDDVRILGVTVGSVDTIVPEGTRVSVHMHIDRRWSLPAGVQAVIMSPTLVTARFIQLTPAYQGGAQLADGAVIPLERTAVPVEWDKIKEQITRLSQTLGPKARHDPGSPDSTPGDGSFGEFITSAADNLRGNGQRLHDTVTNLARAITTLSDGRTDLFAIVRNLHVLVDALSQSHEQIVQFQDHLASVTRLFDDSRNSLGTAIAELDSAVTDIQQFVHDNGSGIRTAADELGSATQVLADRRSDLEQLLHVAPHALANLYNVYQPAQNSLTGAPALTNLANPMQFICSAIAAAGEQGAKQSADLCIQYLGPLLKTLAVDQIPLGAVVGNSVGATPDQIEYADAALAPAAAKSPGASAPPSAAPAPGLPGLLLPGTTPQGGAR